MIKAILETVVDVFVVLTVLLMFLWMVSLDARADEQVMVAQYNENVRIVLTKQSCQEIEGTWRAVAQRIDKQYLRGCWKYEPHQKLVRIQWSADPKDFAVMDAERFKPAVIK